MLLENINKRKDQIDETFVQVEQEKFSTFCTKISGKVACFLCKFFLSRFVQLAQMSQKSVLVWRLRTDELLLYYLLLK